MSFDLRLKGGDLQISKTGDLEIVENTEKLVQDLLKILITPIGANPFFIWYGSPISNTLVGSGLDFQFIQKFADSQIRDTLENFKKIQESQINDGQKVTAEELLAAIKEVKIESHQNDLRSFNVIVKVLTKALSTVPLSFDVEI